MLHFLRDIMKGRIAEPNMFSKVNINMPSENCRSGKTFCPPIMQAGIMRLSVQAQASEISITVSPTTQT